MIAIKPHHFVDIIAALGAGQTEMAPHPYGHALHSVTRQILSDPDVLLCIECGADDICRPCQHNVDGMCDDTIDTSFRPAAPRSKQQYNRLIDDRWCQHLGVQQGDRLTARELCLLIRDCLDDLPDIYRENPPERTAERRVRLEQGIAAFLAG